MPNVAFISIVEQEYVKLLPLELKLTEGINQLSCGVLTATTHSSLPLYSLLLQTITLKLTVNHHARIYHGIITACTSQRHEGKSMNYSIVIQPKLHLLSLDKQSQLFQQTTLSDIVHTLLQNIDLPYALNCIHNPTKIGFCAQYQESSLNFLNRILSHYGISYYFRSKQHHQKLFIQDTLFDPSYKTLTLPLSTSRLEGQTQLFSLHSYNNFVSEKIQSSAYRYSTPNTPSKRETESHIANNNLKHFYYPEAEFHKEDSHIRNRVLNSHLRVRFNHYTATSNAPHLQPAIRIKHPRLDNDLIITEITHIYKQQKNSQTAAKQHPGSYSNSFTLCKSHIQAIDTPNHRKIVLPGMQSALTQANNNASNPQPLLKTNMQFPWCSQQTLHAVRFGQANANHNQGQHFMARAQQENLITYLNGDVSKPLVAAQVYNHHNQAPYSANHKGISTIRSQSLNSHTHSQQNELTLNDFNPEQSIKILAHKTLKTTVNNNSHTNIHNDFTQCISTGDKTCIVQNGKFQLRADIIQLSIGASRLRLDSTGVHFHSDKISLAPHAKAQISAVARINDTHHCPKYENGVQAHGKGTITTGSDNVLFNNRPAARLGDKIQCQHGHTVINASQSVVTVNGQILAHKGAKSSHDGTITVGSSDIFCG